MDVCSIVLADDHVMFRQGVKRIIEETPGLEVVGEANDGLELLRLLKAQEPNWSSWTSPCPTSGAWKPPGRSKSSIPGSRSSS